MTKHPNSLLFRSDVKTSDQETISAILKSTKLFHDFEIDVALELADSFLREGEKSGYHFLLAELSGKTVGFAIFGPTPCTKSSWDLYWIAILKNIQGNGLGTKLLEYAEQQMIKKDARRCWIETSSQPSYSATCRFYRRNGYSQQAQLNHFYDEDDHLLIFGKDLLHPEKKTTVTNTITNPSNPV